MRSLLKIILLICMSFFSFAQATEKLPDLLDQAPRKTFSILGPVTATKGKMEEAEVELLKQAQKLGADAVILKECKPGAIKRDGLSWSKYDAACEGLAIKY